jgi:phosphoribosylformylglycinamidine synthase
VGRLVREAIRRGVLGSAHDCSDGGLCVALAESSIASDLGLSVDLDGGAARLDRALFAEGGSRIVVSVKAEHLGEWEELIGDHRDCPVSRLGTVTAQPRVIIRSDQIVVLDLDLSLCRSAYSNALPRRISSDVDLSG